MRTSERVLESNLGGLTRGTIHQARAAALAARESHYIPSAFVAPDISRIPSSYAC